MSTLATILAWARDTFIDIDVAVSALTHSASRCVLIGVRRGLVVPTRGAHSVGEPCITCTSILVGWRTPVLCGVAHCTIRICTGLARRLYTRASIFARLTSALIDVVARVSVTVPSKVACAVVTAWASVAALGVEWVAIVLASITHLNLVLA